MTAGSQEAPASDGAATGTDGRTGSYVYGVIRAGVQVPEGLTPLPPADEDDAELGLVTQERVAAVVSTIAVDRPLGTREDLIAHEQVVNAIARETTILPMRFGGVVADDDAVADELLAGHEDYLLGALEQLDGRVEFSLRGDYDQDVVLGRILESDPEIQRLSESIRGVDEDASYYDRIALGEAISKALDRLREEDAAAVLDALDEFAEATMVKEPAGENGAVHVAFLVPEERRTDFEGAVDDLGDAWGGRVLLTLVGPTAAFDFLPPAPDVSDVGED